MQELNLGIGSHISITYFVMQTLQLVGFGRGGGCCKTPLYAPPPLICYISLLDSLLSNYETPFLLTTYSNFSVLNFSLNVLLLYSSYYCFPTSRYMKTVLVVLQNSAMMHAHSTLFPRLLS